jgi:hypothetical protein
MRIVSLMTWPRWARVCVLPIYGSVWLVSFTVVMAFIVGSLFALGVGSLCRDIWRGITKR